jgi:UDP-N-acetylmuramoyl-L-alanyl-D-glutamate--2,6-diaminopimelate ligase
LTNKLPTVKYTDKMYQTSKVCYKVMTFKELLALVSTKNSPQVCIDSRLVKDGDVFVAIKGTIFDGHDFIDQATINGAKYIVCQQDKRQKLALSEVEGIENGGQKNHKVILVEDSTESAAILAQAARGYPASQLTNLAVTGTNGKTTVAYLVHSVIRQAGQKCGLIGTIIYDTGSVSSQSILTTPDCLLVADAQQQMIEAGSKYMVIEASSHALDQNRLAGINFKAAAFTNLAGDHLDYHKTKEDYLAAKTKLFTALAPDATAVLNRQSPEAERIAKQTKAKILWYAIDEPTDITAHIESMDINGTIFTIDDNCLNSKLKTQNSKLLVRTPLLGLYNVSNHLAAAGLCLAAGFDLETIATGLSALQAIPGRLEQIKGNGFSVIIDYAHTDDALKNVLVTLKPLCKGRLIVVFGCGGDRDRTKRPRMARVAEQLADIVVVTSDNPRTESPEAIIKEIVAGFENGPAIQNQKTEDRRQKTEILAQRNTHDAIRITQYARRNTKIIEPDRRKAIEFAIDIAAKDDIVLIAGKGHENYQIIGSEKFDFSDKAVAEEQLQKRICSSKSGVSLHPKGIK